MWSARTAKFTIRWVILFFFNLSTITWSGRLAEIRWSCISESQTTLCVSFSRTDSGLCIYHLIVWSNLNFLHNSQWITFRTQSCLVSYSFYTNLLHLLFIWLVVSSLSPHNLHLLFCCILSLTLLVLLALFCAAIRRDSVCFLAMFGTSRMRFRQYVVWNIDTVVFFPPIFVS